MEFDFQNIMDKFREWVDSLGEKIRNLPDYIMNMGDDEKIAWGCIVLGAVFVVTAVILW